MSIKTQEQITAEISANVSDPLQKQNTAAKMRQVLNDLNDTMFSLQSSLITYDNYGEATLYPFLSSGSTGATTTAYISSSNISFKPANGQLTTSGNAFINGVTVGKGTGNVFDNTALGYHSLYSITSGESNVGVGYEALKNTTTGTKNVAVGLGSLTSNINGYENVAVGYQSLKNNTSGLWNCGIGKRALYNTTTGVGNVGVGKDAGYKNSTGGNNVAIGEGALFNNTIGNNNTALGRQSLYYLNTEVEGEAQRNVGIGSLSGPNLSTGQGNVFIGYGCGENISTGNYNTFIGANFNASSDVSNNIALSDGQGNQRLRFNNTGELSLNGPSVSSSEGIVTSHKVLVTINNTQYYIALTSVEA